MFPEELVDLLLEQDDKEEDIEITSTIYKRLVDGDVD